MFKRTLALSLAAVGATLIVSTAVGGAYANAVIEGYQPTVVTEYVEGEPVTITKTVEVEKIVEVPSAPVVNTITEYETVEVEVPGPIQYVDVPGPERIVEVTVETLPVDWEGILADANRRGWEDARIELQTEIASAFATPCEYEDSANCYWDAATSGNGIGQSFVDIGGIAYYLGN